MPADQHVTATGVYQMGSYRVVFRRPLDVQVEGNVSLRPGSTHPVAFAVWDGANQGARAVSPWIDLAFPHHEQKAEH